MRREYIKLNGDTMVEVTIEEDFSKWDREKLNRLIKVIKERGKWTFEGEDDTLISEDEECEREHEPTPWSDLD